MTTFIVVAIIVFYSVIITIIAIHQGKKASEMEKRAMTAESHITELNRILISRDKLIKELGSIKNEADKKKETIHTGNNYADFNNSLQLMRNSKKKRSNS